MKYFVTCNDSFMSGWGMAADKVNKLVIECESITEVYKVMENLKSHGGMKYINYHTKMPKYNDKKFYVQHKTKKDVPVWFV